MLDESFTSDRLQSQITNLPYPIVHLATHGQFSSRAEDTFLLTWDDRINVTELDQLLQQRDFAKDTPIELLILSACQTAAGDKQSSLRFSRSSSAIWCAEYGSYVMVSTR